MPTEIPAIRGDVMAPADHGWDTAQQAWNLAADQRPALVVAPADAADVAAVIEFAPQQRVAGGRPRHGSQCVGDRVARRHDPAVDATHAGRRIDAEARIARVEAGTLAAEVSEGPRRSDYSRSRARRQTSASSVTRLPAVSAGSGASTGWPPTTSRRSRSSRPTASFGGRPRPRIPSSSGPYGAAEAALESSPRSSTACFRTASSTAACSCGPSSATPRCSVPGTA
jgi:hypothetical protein